MPTDHHPFEKMPKRDSAVNTVVPSTPRRRSPRFLHNNTPDQEPPSTLRRSSRLSHPKKNSPEPEAPRSPEPRSHHVKKSSKSLDGSRNIAILSCGSKGSVILRRSSRLSMQDSKKSGGSANGSNNRGDLSSGSRESRTTNNAVVGFQSLRRSQRISKTGGDICYKEELSDTEEAEDFVAKSKRNTRKVVLGLQAAIGERGAKEESDGECRVVAVSPKRKGDECEESNGTVHGWTKEQELALQRAYLVAKPTPHFWKKVSKLRISKTGGDICYKEELSDTEEAEDFVAKSKRNTRKVVLGLQAAIGERGAKEESDGECRVVAVSPKRKGDECEESNGTVHGWTKEQELALQRAYLVAKPTPHFWKKVSKLVPGKSAQDCFDKINSDYLTPLQHQRISRAKKRRNSSPIPHLHLSASKVLKPIETKVKRPGYNKQKSHVLHKNARHLLRMHHHQNQDHEADLFSVLEPNLDLSTQALQHGIILSTPKNLKQKHGFLQKFDERCSSGHKKPLSRFSGLREKALVSPLVLKQVKNKVLHEKYIDQLHSRDAKRKTASEQAKKSRLRMEDRKENILPRPDVVRAAKNALVSDAITMLQQIQTNAKSNSSDSEDYAVSKTEGDESETEI